MKFLPFLSASLISLALVTGFLVLDRHALNLAAADTKVTNSDPAADIGQIRATTPLGIVSGRGGSDSPMQQISPDLTDIALDNPEVVGPARIVTTSRIVELGDVSMLMYRDNTTVMVEGKGHAPLWLYFKNGATGETSHVQLPYFEDVTSPRLVEHVLTSPDDLWIFYRGINRAKSSDTTLRIDHFSLSGSPLPTSTTLVSSQLFGNADSRSHSLQKLKSGGLLGVWHQQKTTENRSLDVGFAYRSPQGVWSTLFPVNVPNFQGGGSPSSRSTAVQHPSDDSIWTFFKRDSYHSMIAIRLTESNSGLELDWVNEQYITSLVDGIYAPEPEFPDLAASASSTRNSILLAYQNRQTQLFSISPFVKGAHVTLTEIQADGSKSFVDFPTYVERVTRLGLIEQNGMAWLAYRPVDEEAVANNDRAYDDVYVSGYDLISGSWTNPLFLGSMIFTGSSNSGVPLIFGADGVDFATDIDDGRVHFFTLRSRSTTDVTAPDVAIASPTTSALLSGVVELEAEAQDDTGVTLVEFYVNNVLLGGDATAPYKATWDTSVVANGPHTVLARAYDAAGNMGVSGPVIVNVDNSPPAVSLTSPMSGAMLSGTVDLVVDARDEYGLDRVEFYRDWGVFLGSIGPAPYILSWNTAAVADGSYSLFARAIDRAGNQSLSIPVNVTVRNTSPPPEVIITSPRPGASVPRRSTVVIRADSPNNDISRVIFYVNGEAVCSYRQQELSCWWDVPAPPNRTYRLQAQVYDSAGQVGSSPPVNVTSSR